MRKLRFITVVIVFSFLAFLSYAGDEKQKLDDAVRKIRANPADFESWELFRDLKISQSLPEGDITRFEPIFIALCDNQPDTMGNTGTMILMAVILPATDTLYDVNDPANNSVKNLKIIASYIKKLYWYGPDGRRTRYANLQAIVQVGKDKKPVLALGGCKGEIIATCPFIHPGEANELNEDWRDLYRKAFKKDRSLSGLSWLFLSKNRHVWGVGFEVGNRIELPGQPISAEARLEVISKSSNGACRLKLNTNY